MKDDSNVEMRINGQETTVIDGMMELRMEVVVRFKMPEQNKRLPAVLDEALEEVGQQFKRRTYEQAMEGAALGIIKRAHEYRRIVEERKKALYI